VAREAREILATSPDLSVGVITFYAAQRDAILEEMAALGLADPDDEVGHRIRDQWLQTRDGRERLRVGTVDAFQGKEFDVVLLSLTRSNAIQVTDEATRRRRYGFLLLENRLCVAMSRQRCLLILVGDLDMARGEEARQSVPALAAFAKLCEEGVHGRIVRT
jgi:superfamily I DNA and/or RNA helicase